MEQKNKKVSPKQIKEAIAQKAIVLKRKIEIYQEVKKFNDELKQLNEVNTVGRGFMAGPGFKNRVDAQGNQRDSHEHIIGGKGAVTGRSATAVDVEMGNPKLEAKVGSNDGQGGRIYRFEELYGLEEEMDNLGVDAATEEGPTTLDELQSENSALKERLGQIEEMLSSINEGVFKKIKGAAKTEPQGADEKKKNN